MYISLILFLNSCSDWEQPIQLPNSGGIKSSRVLLVEEFTGASCPNCPSGTAELKGIIDKYPDTLFLFARYLHIALSIFVKLFTLFVVVSG